MNRAIMLDLEAVGRCICQIGCVVFDTRTGDIIDELCVNIDPIAIHLTHGFKLDWSFWEKQPTEIFDSVFCNQVLPTKGLQLFVDFVNKYNDCKIWSHSLYDFTLIQDTMGRVLHYRLPYRRSRDITTLVGLSGISIKKYDKTLKTHNALSDCKYQIKYVVDAMNKLRSK